MALMHSTVANLQPRGAPNLEDACTFLACEDAASRRVRVPAEYLDLMFCSMHADHVTRALHERRLGQVRVSELDPDRLRVEVAPWPE